VAIGDVTRERLHNCRVCHALLHMTRSFFRSNARLQETNTTLHEAVRLAKEYFDDCIHLNHDAADQCAGDWAKANKFLNHLTDHGLLRKNATDKKPPDARYGMDENEFRAWEQASDEVYDPESRSDEREEGEGK